MRGRERVAAIGVSVVVAYLLLVGGTSGGMVLPESRTLSLAIATAVFAGWAVAAWRSPEWRPRSIFIPVLIGACLVMAVSASLSRSPRIGAESLAQAVILGSGYLFLVELLRRPAFRTRILFVAAAIGVVVSLAYVAVVVVEWTWFWQLVGRLATPPLRPDYASLLYGNPAPMLAISILLGAVLVGTVPRTRAGAAMATAGVCVALLTALLTGTRAGWLAIAGATAVVALLVLRTETGRAGVREASHRLAGSRSMQAATGITLVATVVVGIALAPGLLRRLDAGGEDTRTSFYVASIRMFAESPIVGVGPGMWPRDRALNTQSDEVDYFVAAAHNLYLHTLAEMGLLGIGVGLVGAAAIVWLLRNGLRDPTPARRRWALLASFSTAYFALHATLDFHVSLPAVILGVALPIAVLDATATRHPWRRLTPERLTQPPLFALGCVALASATAFAWWTTPATNVADTAARAGNVGDWVAADQAAAQARQLDPVAPAYRLLEGLTAAHTGDDIRALDDLAAFAGFTDMPEAWVDVAALRLRAHDIPGAVDALDRASRLGIQHAALAVAISDLELSAGRPAAAIEAGAAAIAMIPSLVSDPWWSSSPERAAIYPHVLARSLERATPDARWQIELMAGNSDAATSAAAGAADPALARDVIAAWQGDSVAGTRVFARCADAPLDGPMGWCARLASRAGQIDEADRYRRLAAMLHINLDTTGELRIFTTLPEPSLAGDVSNKAGGAWRREVLWDVLVPGVMRVGMAQ